jgi:transcription initiation factor TFIIB
MRTDITLEEESYCPECGSSRIVRNDVNGELFCENCGLVVEDTCIDQGPEWRAFNDDDRNAKARTGPPADYTKADKGLSTVISWQNKDSYGKAIPMRNKTQLYRLRKWERRMRLSGPSKASLVSGMSDINTISSRMSLSRNVRDAAIMIFKRAVQKKLLRGRSTDGIVLASIYAACRQCGMPYTLYEFSNVSNLDKKEVGKNYRFLAANLSLQLMPILPQDYVVRFCDDLSLTKRTQDKTLEIIEKAEHQELISGRSPTGVVAAAIYMASVLCRESITQKNIADVAGVTEVTVRNRYKELSDRLGINIKRCHETGLYTVPKDG